MCYPVWMLHIKITLAANAEIVAHVTAAGLLSRYLNDPLPYI